MSGCSIRKIVMVLLCGFAVSGTGFGGLVLDCDSNAQINGIGTSVSIPSGSKTYTVELWMKPTVLETGERRCLGQFSGDKGRMLVAYTGGTAGIFNGGGNGWTMGTTKFAKDTWYHVACVFDDSSTNKTVVYVNGVPEGVNTNNAVGINARYLTLGGATFSQELSGTTRDYEAFKGRIADVRVWSVERSQAEILANYQSRLAGDEAGLLAYWPLDALGDNGQTVEEARSASCSSRGGTRLCHPSRDLKYRRTANGSPARAGPSPDRERSPYGARTRPPLPPPTARDCRSGHRQCRRRSCGWTHS